MAPARVGSAVNQAIYGRALQYATPATIPYVRRSAALAQALEQLQEQASSNIRTPGALASNLLADALLEFAGNRANKALEGRQQGDMADMAKLATLGLPQAGAVSASDQPPPAPAAPMAPPSAAVAPPAPTGAPPAPTPAQAALGDVLSPQDRDAAVRMAYGEARGEPVDGQRAAVAVALNRAHKSGKALADVISAPHQFAGYGGKALSLDPNSPDYQRIAANVGPLLDGSVPDPTHGADHFYNPQLAHPSWGGPGMDIGHHRFMALNDIPPGAQNAMAQGAPAAAMQGPTAQPPPPMPPQMAQGPAPNPAPAPPPMGPAPAPPPMPPGGGASYHAPPHGLAPTPDEQQLMQRLLNSGNPAMFQQGMDMATKLRERYMTPEDAPKDMRWDPGQGHYVPKAPFEDLQGAPNEILQRGPDGQLHVQGRPSFGPVGSGQRMNGDQSVSNLNVQQRPAYKIPGANGLFVDGPDGRPVKVADDSFTPKDLGDRLTKLQSSDAYKLLDNATNMYSAAVQAAQRPGGISDVELRDFAARQFSGGVARQFNVEALNKAQGAWANIKQFVPELISGQKMSPQARHALLQAMHDDAMQARNAFGALSSSDEAFVGSQGMSLKPYLGALTRDLPEIPGQGAIPNGMPAAQNAAPHGAADPWAAIERVNPHLAAEMKRRGLNPPGAK